MKKLKDLFKKRDKREVLELTPEEAAVREKIEEEFYYKTFWMILGSAVFMVFLFAIIFFLNVEGKEDTKVPNLKGLTLHDAVIKLQERALYPKLNVKNTTPKEKNLIISQGISPGSVVKAGRIVPMTVSLGGVIDKVGSYEGQTIQAVRAELQKLFAGTSSKPLLVIEDPISIISEEPEGTILSQDPPPGTEIIDVTKLTFHVSRGEKQSTYVVPTMVGLNFVDAIKKISQWSIRYRFSVRDARGNEEPGVIVSQSPDRGTTTPWSTIVEMVMTKPENYPSDYAFGVLEIVVPSYPISIPMSFDRVNKDGTRDIVFTKRTFGGALTIPYLEEVGTQLIITVDGKEIESFTVRQK